MRISSRFFEAGRAYRLCSFEVEEGSEWSPPDGTHLIFAEPIIREEVMEGLYLWALVPDSQMVEVLGAQNDE